MHAHPHIPGVAASSSTRRSVRPCPVGEFRPEVTKCYLLGSRSSEHLPRAPVHLDSVLHFAKLLATGCDSDERLIGRTFPKGCNAARGEPIAAAMRPLNGVPDDKPADHGCNPHDGAAGGFASRRQIWFAQRYVFKILFKPFWARQRIPSDAASDEVGPRPFSGECRAAWSAAPLSGGNFQCGALERGPACGGGSVPLPCAGRMPAPQRARRPRYDWRLLRVLRHRPTFMSHTHEGGLFSELG
jgi:hypothetical protein